MADAIAKFDPDMLFTAQEFAHLGDGRIGYVRAVKVEEARRLFPGVADIPPAAPLFSLHGADGEPILLADSRETAVLNAWSQELTPVYVQ
jgi:hypothetical protein